MSPPSHRADPPTAPTLPPRRHSHRADTPTTPTLPPRRHSHRADTHTAPTLTPRRYSHRADTHTAPPLAPRRHSHRAATHTAPPLGLLRRLHRTDGAQLSGVVLRVSELRRRQLWSADRVRRFGDVCCTCDTNECGAELPTIFEGTGSVCLTPQSAGTPSSSCPESPRFSPLLQSSCCTPTGECGLVVRGDSFGSGHLRHLRDLEVGSQGTRRQTVASAESRAC